MNRDAFGGGYTRRTKAVGRHRRRRPISPTELRLRVAGAVLLAASASIHLYLYLTGYRSIPTIGWLFLMQFIVGYILTVAVSLLVHQFFEVPATKLLRRLLGVGGRIPQSGHDLRQNMSAPCPQPKSGGRPCAYSRSS